MKEVKKEDNGAFNFSEREFLVFSLIATEKATYNKKIAEEINIKTQTVNTYIKNLRDSNLILRGDRTQAQHYKVNWENIFDKIYNMFKNAPKYRLDFLLPSNKVKELLSKNLLGKIITRYCFLYIKNYKVESGELDKTVLSENTLSDQIEKAREEEDLEISIGKLEINPYYIYTKRSISEIMNFFLRGLYMKEEKEIDSKNLKKIKTSIHRTEGKSEDFIDVIESEEKIASSYQKFAKKSLEEVKE